MLTKVVRNSDFRGCKSVSKFEVTWALTSSQKRKTNHSKREFDVDAQSYFGFQTNFWGPFYFMAQGRQGKGQRFLKPSGPQFWHLLKGNHSNWPLVSPLPSCFVYHNFLALLAYWPSSSPCFTTCLKRFNLRVEDGCAVKVLKKVTQSYTNPNMKHLSGIQRCCKILIIFILFPFLNLARQPGSVSLFDQNNVWGGCILLLIPDKHERMLPENCLVGRWFSFLKWAPCLVGHVICRGSTSKIVYIPEN